MAQASQTKQVILSLYTKQKLPNGHFDSVNLIDHSRTILGGICPRQHYKRTQTRALILKRARLWVNREIGECIDQIKPMEFPGPQLSLEGATRQALRLDGCFYSAPPSTAIASIRFGGRRFFLVVGTITTAITSIGVAGRRFVLVVGTII
jgi:hypothetical protein